MRLRRREDWPRRLAAEIRRRRRTPFAWGRHDCCLAACACVEAMTGVHPARAAPGIADYADRAGAEARMQANGGVDGLAEICAAAAGAVEIAPAFAQRGDVVLAPVETPQGVGAALGVVDLDGRHAVFAAPRGWFRLPLAHARRAWRIG